jgi:DNA-binding NarL/FixJ family response regulator
MTSPNITVCIVEDDADLRESIAHYIRETDGFECVGTYPTAEEALESLPAQKPDIVLVDINLPGMDGIQCVKKLKLLIPGLQAMMLTVYDNSDRIFEALAAGACGYLIKRTPPQKLIEAILDVRNGGSPMSSSIARKVVQAFQPSPHASALIEHLAPREQQVLELLAKGRAYKQIADEMNLSMGTIRTYIRRVYEKLHVNCRTDAVVKYLDATGSKPRLYKPA